ncbi:hypothetical protein [Brevibacillus panacihumi]|uniref:hypothetical protein n=1 Tax=Brevibacillus panacihumi TaxID=497735 RepID=UPI003D1C060D
MRPDDCIQSYLQTLQKRMDVVAVLMLPDPDMLIPSREGLFMLAVVNHPQAECVTRRLRVAGRMIVEQQISIWKLEQGILRGLDERLVTIIQKADVIWEKRAGYVTQIKQRQSQLPEELQKKFICIEYSRLLRYFCETKECLQRGIKLDAYHAMIMSLHSWARCIVYEAGRQPEAALWAQVKLLDPSVYKLYEELSVSAEALDKRIELLVLAIEFWMSSAMKESVRFIIELMEKKEGPWRLAELMNHPEILHSQIELPLLLEKMVQRSLIREVALYVEELACEELCFILSE